MAGERTLTVKILGDASSAQKAFGATESGASSLAGTFGKVAVVAGGLAVAGAGAAFALGSSFDDAYDTIRVGTGATGAQLEALKGSFKNVVKDVPADFASASAAISELHQRTGLTGQGLESMAKQQLELARITKTDLSANIAATTRVFGDWGIATENQSAAMDKMFRASQSTGVGIDMLASSAVQFGAPLRAMGFSFDQTIALLGKFEKEGVNAELVMGAMRKGLAAFAKAGEDAPEALRRLIDEIKSAETPTRGTALAMEVFGTKAGPDMAAAIREGRFDVEGLINTIAGGKETIIGAGEDTADFGEKWTEFKNNVLVGLEPLAVAAFDAVGNGMKQLSDWWDANGDNVKNGLNDCRDAIEKYGPVMLVVSGIILTLFIPHLVALGVQATITAAQQVTAWVSTQIAAIGAALVHSGQVLIMVGGWALLGARALLHAGMVVAGWVMTGVAAVGAALTMAGQVALMVAGWVLLSTQSLIHAARVAAAWIIAMGPIAWVIAAVVALVALVIWKWQEIKDATLSAWNKTTEFVRDAWHRISGAVSSGISTAVDFVRGLPGKVLGALGNLGSTLWHKGRDLIQGLLDGAGSLLSRIGSFFLDRVPAFIKGPFKAALGISSPSTVFAGYGRNLVEGLAIGVSSNRSILDAAMASLSVTAGGSLLLAASASGGSVSSAAATSTAATGQPGRSFQQTNNFYGITDENEIARMAAVYAARAELVF